MKTIIKILESIINVLISFNNRLKLKYTDKKAQQSAKKDLLKILEEAE